MRTFIYALLFLACSFCCSCSQKDSPDDKEVTITFAESDEDFPNPERGFYHYSETTGSSFKALSKSELEGYRMPQKSSKASYLVVSTLVFRYFVLDSFKDGPLSNDFLNALKSDFAIARSAGVKLIPRFTYSVDTKSGNCPESFICPPYGDASKTIVLQHISQLQPVLTENSDVIACIQLGFIGTWGENYYTDFFGDASSNGQGKLLDNNWQDRIDVLKALLDATPDEIMIQVRYPQIKQRFVYGIQALVSSSALTENEAFSGTDKARIGYHNDCFLASSDDYGTYEDYGNSSTPRRTENSTLRKYFSDDSRFVVVGGETCSDEFSPQNDCEPNGHAEKEMMDMHYSFLNTNYNNEVNNDWQSGGCMESIKRKLGYRFVLKSGTFPASIKKTNLLHMNLKIENIGYTSPFNARPVELKLRNISTKSISTFKFNTDIRKWYRGEILIEEDFQIDSLKPGEYEILLNLPDKHSSISARPEYSIRLANKDLWEEETGFNKLNHTIQIED